MKTFSLKRIIFSIVAIIIIYGTLFLIVHFADTVPYLENAFTGNIETTEISAAIILGSLRFLFYFIIPSLIALLCCLIIERNIKLYLRILVETFSFVYVILCFIKIVYFFMALDKLTGISILDGVDLGIMTISLILNIVCYKNPYFLFLGEKDKENKVE